MLSKKRQIMFEVLGRRTAARAAESARVAESTRVPEPAREAPAGGASRVRRSRPKRARARVAVAGARAMQLARSWWIALAGIVIVCTGFVAWRVRASGDPSAPVLQKNVATEAPVSAVEEPAARNAYSVCAMARSYRNKTEQKQAAERVQEIVDWLGYHSDPDFRDVFGSHEPGKEPGSGTYRVYVGSARSRRELVPLTDKLTRLVWNRQRPFQNATVKMVEGAIATPGSKDSSDER